MRRDWFAALWFLAPLLWLFRHALFLGEVFAFRDAAHYYFPFYQYVQTRWQEGLPLWNPLDGIGQPLLGDPTAAVMYPGKLLFLLPAPYALCFVLYIVGHLWLGGYGAYKLARGFRASWSGAVVAGLAYELSGQVLFQYCNPIYCVGAAWLPWAIRYLSRALRWRGVREVGLLCGTLSMMILGGDPQTAYHVLLLGLLYAVVSLGIEARPLTSLAKNVGMLCLVGASTVLLAAVQVFPTYEWAQRSDRALRDGPRSAYEWVGDATSSLLQGSELPRSRHLWFRPPRQSHGEMVYQFSVGPWRWLELVWPNVSGHPFPVHRRWLSGFPGEGRTWTPSLYLGLLPLMLGLFRFRLTRASTQTKWWSWVVVLAAAAAVGNYGLGWIVDEFRYQFDATNFANTELQPGLGGLYWLMTVALPGYIQFRYPAKLWTLATLGLAVLAAKAWPAVAMYRQRLATQGVRFIVISLVLAALSFAPITSSWLSQVPANQLFGPIDVGKARGELAISFLHAAMVAASLILLLMRDGKKSMKWMLVLVTAELVVAQASLVQTVQPARLRSKSPLEQGATLYRCEPVRAYPRLWQQSASVLRFEELQQNDTATLMPKHHLSVGARSVQSAVPMTCADYFVLAQLARQAGRKVASGHQLPHRKWIDLVGAEHVFAPRGDYLFSQEAVHSGGTSALQHFINDDALPRTWLVHHWQTLPDLGPWDQPSLLQRTRQVMLDGSTFRDFDKVAVVEASSPVPAPPTSDARVGDVCEIVEEEEERILLRVKTDSPAIVILADQFFPGWKAYVASQPAAWTRTRIWRVNRVMRGVYVKAGDHQVEFRYRPVSAIAGFVTSALAWTTLVLLMMARRGGKTVKSES